jgi:hypothetical protein
MEVPYPLSTSIRLQSPSIRQSIRGKQAPMKGPARCHFAYVAMGFTTKVTTEVSLGGGKDGVEVSGYVDMMLLLQYGACSVATGDRDAGGVGVLFREYKRGTSRSMNSVENMMAGVRKRKSYEISQEGSLPA